MTAEPPTAADLPATTYAAALRRYDQYIADLQAQHLEPAEIRRLAAEMFAKLKAEFPARPQRPAFAIKPSSEPLREMYSIVLKSCADRERLAGRLSLVLRRSPVAIRMAVDMVPCIIVYKSREADIKAAVQVLDSENLYYTVVKGEFAAEPRLEEIIPDFATLDGNLRRACCNVPAALWLGETVRLVAAASDTAGGELVLVVTDQALLLTGGSKGGEPAEWRVLSYARLSGVVRHDASQALEFIQRDGARSEWLRLTDPGQRGFVYDHVNRAVTTAAVL